VSPKIVLIGQPNAGKSTLFNVFSDIKSASSNFSGTSVEIMSSRIAIGGKEYLMVDLPGIYSLNPLDDAEKVTYQYLLHNDIELIVNVMDSTLLARSLELTVELMEFGIPMVIVLNMWDETTRKGLMISPEKLEQAFDIPVFTTSALHGKGVKALLEGCRQRIDQTKQPLKFIEYTHHVEKSVKQLEAKLNETNLSVKGSSRFYAIKAIENPELIPGDVLALFSEDLQQIGHDLHAMHNKDGFETISYERHHVAMKIMESVSHYIDLKTIPFREKLDRFLLHPIFGYIPLLTFFLLFFALIYVFGDMISQMMEIPFQPIPALYEPLKESALFLWHTCDGVYQGILGTFGIVLPYFFPLILLTSLFEDTGYLSRIAFLLDGLMHRIGLHGKSVSPFILGFGCTVPAIYNIRILENKRDRNLTALLIPFIPCAARTSVILALTTAFTGPLWAILIYVIIMIAIAVSGKIISLFLKKPTGLVLEIPDLKRPQLKNSMAKTWYKIKDFLQFALPFLIIGSVVMSWLEYLKINHVLNQLFSPLVKNLLGLPEVLGSTLVYGFFRKELIVVMMNQAFGVTEVALLPLAVEQIVIFLVFVSLYFPCFSTFVILWKEFGKGVVFLSSLLSLVVATVFAMCIKFIILH
jgi:ferrous iron transport protein B